MAGCGGPKSRSRPPPIRLRVPVAVFVVTRGDVARRVDSSAGIRRVVPWQTQTLGFEGRSGSGGLRDPQNQPTARPAWDREQRLKRTPPTETA